MVQGPIPKLVRILELAVKLSWDFLDTQLLDEAQGLIDMGNSDGPWRSIRLTGTTTAAALDISLGEGQGSTFTHSSF